MGVPAVLLRSALSLSSSCSAWAAVWSSSPDSSGCSSDPSAISTSPSSVLTSFFARFRAADAVPGT